MPPNQPLTPSRIVKKGCHPISFKNRVLYFANIRNNLIFVSNLLNGMIVSFEKEYLRDLYEKGKTKDKKHRFQPEIIKRYKERIKTLESAEKIEDLFAFKSLNYEILKGDKSGISSIRVNNQYRIEFIHIQKGAEPIVSVCNILELSNHYK